MAILPEGWPRPSGYSQGMVAEGKLLFIAGQIGREEAPLPSQLKRGFAAQFDQALANVCAVLEAAGGSPEDLVRVTLYLTNRAAYLRARQALGASWRRHLGRHFPAMSAVVVAQLIEEKALLEIEATAVISPR